MRTCRPTFTARHEYAATTALARFTTRRARWLPVAASIGVLVSGCQPWSSAPPPDSATAAPVTVAVATKAPTRAAALESGAGAAPDGSVAALPPGAMAYVMLRPALMDHILAVLPPEARDEVLSELARMLSEPASNSAELARALTLAPDQPVLFAVVSPPADGISQIVDDIANAKQPDAGLLEKAIAQAKQLDPPLLQLMRVHVTLAKPDATGLLDGLAEPLGAKPVNCETATPACAPFPDRPVAIVTGQRTVAVAYLKGSALTIDIAQSYFLESDDPRIAKALAAFHRRTGGPQRGCVTLDPNATASLCVLPDGAGQLGAATGLATLLLAISGAPLQSTEIRKIVEYGRREADGAGRIAAREPRWLDDGTLSVRGRPGATAVAASWATTQVSDAPLRQAFSRERCAESGEELGKTLLPELAKVFDAKPASDAEARRKIEGIQEAGWAAWPVVWARAWPAYLPVLMGSRLDWSTANHSKTCIRYDAGRLEINGTVDLSALVTR